MKGRISFRENYLRNARMQKPGWIPSTVVISGASWRDHKQDMEELILLHPDVFHLYQPGSTPGFGYMDSSLAIVEAQEFTDSWGCTWHRALDGLEGVVVGHPLADWEKLARFRPPDPLVEGDRGPAKWAEIEERAKRKRKRGDLLTGGPPHGFFFDRLMDLRGFENLMMDLATEDERLPVLIGLLLEHNRTLVNRWLSIGVDVVEFADDLGTQTASIISPHMFHRWFTPAYRELMTPCKQAGRLVALHSDGYVLNLIDEFIEAGVDIINLQDLVHGIDNLAREVKGRICIRLDVDRQKIIPFGSRIEIRELIEEEVRKLGDPRGGLEFIAGIYPPTTPDSVDALALALKEFSTYWWDGRGG